MKFLIIGPKRSANTEDLLKEIKEKGFEGEAANLKELSFQASNNVFNIFYNNKDLVDFDIVFLRGYNVHCDEARIIAQYIIKKGKIVIDEVLARDFIPGKLSEARKLTASDINYIDTQRVISNGITKEVLKKEKLPVIIKPIYGEQGKGILKINTKDELETFFKRTREYDQEYMIQKYIPLEEDFRVFVVGDKILGGIKRKKKEGDFRTNISVGADAEKVLVSDEMREISLRAVKILNCEVAGVDLVRFDKKFYVIEVNFTPQWQGFKKTTGINPAKEIIKYAIDKYEKQK